MKQGSERTNTGLNAKCRAVGVRAESQTKAQLPLETEWTTERARAGKEDPGSRALRSSQQGTVTRN